jgi:hypothetical protein
MASCWESLTSALSPASTSSSSQREQLLAREERLRERADALRRRHDEVVRHTAADEAATLDAQTLQREAVAQRRVLMVTKEKNDQELPALIMELKAKDERVRVLEAIFDTVKTNKKPVYR